MDPFGMIGSAVSGIGSMVGGLFNANQAGINRDDQRYYTEHAHQVEVNDLRQAGLNPILSATGGRGAPMPGMSSPAGGGEIASGAQSLGRGFADAQALSIGKQQEQGYLLDNINKVKQGVGLDIDNEIKGFQTDVQRSKRNYLDRMAAAEVQLAELDNQFRAASTEAAAASAKSYRASTDKSYAEVKNLKLRGGFQGVGGLMGDVYNLGSRAAQGVSEWLSKPEIPIGRSSAKEH